MALRNSVSAAACVMVGLTLIGNVLKGAGSGAETAPARPGAVAAATKAPEQPAPRQVPTITATVTSIAAAEPAAAPTTVDETPTGSIDPDSGLHRPNPAAYGDAARQGSSLAITGAEAVNYLAGNTLRREGAGVPPRFTYFASRGIVADGTEREFVARGWDRNRADICVPGRDGAPECRPIRILLDAKEELQGGRLGTVTIGDETAELIKGNVLRVPQHIPFLDSTVAHEPAAAAQDGTAAGWAGLVEHTAAVTTDAGTGRRFVYYGADNRRLDIQPVEAGPEGGRAVAVAVGRWRLAKTTLCESGPVGVAAQACFTPQPLANGEVRLVPVGKGGQALRAVALPETRIRAVAED